MCNSGFIKLFGAVFAVLFLCSGCIQQIAVSTVGNIVHDGFGAFMEEEDLDFAGQALPANLKLLEAMLRSDPDNRRILLLLSEGYSSYSLGFVEDIDVERARVFYLRGRDFGLRVLRQDEGIRLADILDARPNFCQGHARSRTNGPRLTSSAVWASSVGLS